MAYQNYNQPNRFGYQNNNYAPKPVEAKALPAAFVDEAERVINGLPDKTITSTKIRKLFGLFTDLYNEVKRVDEEELSAEQQKLLITARIRLVYECGRGDQDVSLFVTNANLLSYLKWIGADRSRFLKFHQYFEALVAYHRFRYGDK